MVQNKESDWPEPTIEQAINAGMAIANHYGSTFSKIDVGEPIEPEYLSDREAKQRLLDLADHIMNGTVNTHVEIAKVVRSLGHSMGSMGSVSTKIDLAAFRVYHAIRQRQETFQETQ